MQLGSRVSLSRSQVNRISVIGPVTAGQIFSVGVEVNDGDVRTTEVTAEGGDDEESVVAKLAEALRSSQTVLKVTGDGVGTFDLSGPIGEAFVLVLAGLEGEVLTTAIKTIDSSGRQIGILRVIEIDDGSYKRRKIWTRFGDGPPVEIHWIRVREEHAQGPEFEVRASDILTIVED